MAGETLKDLRYVLRRGDTDNKARREDGKEGKVYGGRFHEDVPESQNWIAVLQKTLATLGFEFDAKWPGLDLSNPSTFDEPTEWAVREFQIAAKYPKVTKKTGDVVDLSAIAGATYRGPTSGVVNQETQAALAVWDAEQLCCTEPTLAALRAGYDVLLEKPMATREEECRQLACAAKEAGRQLQICHVLRYTPHFQAMREIIQSGRLGTIINVSHRENVSYWHMSHSFVRGNWRNKELSSPMILAKCCHDLDILPWLLDRKCERLSSMGSLIHFRAENAPAGAPLRCTDGCPAGDTCPFNALFIYDGLTPLWRSTAECAPGLEGFILKTYLKSPGLIRGLSRVIPLLRQVTDYGGFPRSPVTADPTREGLLAALREGPYGRCVYHCDNDVVDNQVVMMQFEGGLPVTLTMQGHSHIEGRSTRIQGTKAELTANFEFGGSWIEVREHRSGKRERIDTSAQLQKGHGGGDFGIMQGFVRSLRDGGASALTNVDVSLASHLMAFAAEKSRLENGRVMEQEMWGDQISRI